MGMGSQPRTMGRPPSLFLTFILTFLWELCPVRADIWKIPPSSDVIIKQLHDGNAPVQTSHQKVPLSFYDFHSLVGPWLFKRSGNNPQNSSPDDVDIYKLDRRGLFSPFLPSSFGKNKSDGLLKALYNYRQQRKMRHRRIYRFIKRDENDAGASINQDQEFQKRGLPSVFRGGSNYGLSKFYGYRDSPWFSRLFKRPYSRLFKRSGGLDDSAEQDQVDDVKKTKKEKKSCCPGSRTGKKSVPFNDFEVTIPQYIRLKSVEGGRNDQQYIEYLKLKRLQHEVIKMDQVIRALLVLFPTDELEEQVEFQELVRLYKPLVKLLPKDYLDTMGEIQV